MRNEEERSAPSVESCATFVKTLSADGICKPVLLPLLQKLYPPGDSLERTENSVHEKSLSDSKEDSTTNEKIMEKSVRKKISDGVGIMKKKLAEFSMKTDNVIERVENNIRNGFSFFTEEKI